MDNYVGKRLDGRYEIQEIVGVGGMSVVYKAYDNIDDRIVAVKVLKDEFLANDDFRRRFKNESKAIAVLSHPNIVKVYDVNFGDKLQYIVMEYVDGITLKEYINKQGAITWNDALFFMTQILRALQHAHDKGIVHRDIKPQNIILLPNGDIKVTDFGIARFSRSETKTMTESAIGSVHYISPEQAKGDFTDEKADIYSVGVVLYEMLAGNVPFEAENAVSVAIMQLQNEAKRLTDINPDIPLGLEQITAHAMQKNAADRYQTATEMLLDIEEIVKNPKTVFDYSYFVDKEPTKYIKKSDLAKNEIENTVDEEYIEAADPDHKKKVITAIAIGTIVLIAAVVLLVLAITGQFNTSTTTLENFVGYSYDELVDSGSYKYNFKLEYQTSDEYEAGIVIDQNPEAGEKVLADSTVTLYVSKPDTSIVVPNVYGKEQERAIELLSRQGLNSYKIENVSSEQYEAGLVAYTDPKATDEVSADTTITIYVSTGPSTTVADKLTVPDVYGLTQSKAKEFLQSYGFKNISFSTEDSDLDKGIVISQYPASGSSCDENETIKVVVSSGVTTTEAPAECTVSLTVTLPNTGDNDTLIVYVDGTQYQSREVTLDGSDVVSKIQVEYGKKVKVTAKLKTSETSDSKTVTVKTDQNIAIDFTDAIVSGAD